MKPSSLARRRSQHLITFGDPKTGKSTLVAELMMHGYRLTWVSMDNGHEVIFKLPIKPEKLDELLNIIVIPDTKEHPIAIVTCLKLVSGRAVDICDIHGQADCPTCRSKNGSFTRVDPSSFGPKDILVFDHIGQTANSAMNHITKKEKDEYKPEWEDYRVQGTLMDKFLGNIQQAPYNVICITHVTETKMEDGKPKLVPLVGTGPFSANSGKYFDHMVYTEVNSGSHKFGSATTYKASVVTGSRGDYKIEDLKDPKKPPTLAIFFDEALRAAEKDDSVRAAVKLQLVENQLPTVSEPVAEVSAAEIPVTSETSEVTKLEAPKTVTARSPAELLALFKKKG